MSDFPDTPAQKSLRPGRRDFAVLIFLLIAMAAVYWSVLFIHYGYLDDYFWLDLARNHPADIFPTQAVQGRPINGWLLPIIFRHAGGIGGLWRIRALTLCEMAAMGWMFYLALLRGGAPRASAAAVAAMAGVVPAMQVYAAWATSVAVPLSGIFAIAAAMLAGHALEDFHRRWLLLPLASLLVLIAATIYQPTAMVFWPIAAIDLFRDTRRRQLFRRLFIYALVAAAGLFVAWCVLKFGLNHYPKRYSPKRDSFTASPIAKAAWFVQHPLIDSLNLFNLRPNTFLAAAVGILISIGILLRAAWQGLTVAAILLPLSYLPNLLVQESWSSYRTQIGLSWLILVLAWLALSSLASRQSLLLRASLLIAIAFDAGILATQHVANLIALPQNFELSVLKSSLAPTRYSYVTQIILLQPSGDSVIASYSRYDEFGRTSLQAFWVPQSEINLLREEDDPNAARLPVELKPDFHGPPPQSSLSDGTLVVDMRPLGR